MNVNGIVNNWSAAGTSIGKISMGGNQRTNNKEENNRNDLSTITAMQKKDKQNETGLIEMLMKRKESMQKNIEGLQKRLSKISEIKEKLSYEEVTVIEDGRAVIKKVYSDEDSKTLKRLESQETSIAEKIKNLTDDIAGLDSEMTAAMVMEQTRKAEKEKEEKEKALEKAKENNIDTKEEQERHEQLKQNEFLIQGDSIKNYVQSGRITKAKLEQNLTRKENEMATDALNAATTEQSILHHKSPIEESPVPDTSFINEQIRIRDGKFSQSEMQKSGKILYDLKAAINNTQQFIDSQLGRINNEAEDLREEKKEILREEDADKEEPWDTSPTAIGIDLNEIEIKQDIRKLFTFVS